MRMCFFFAGIAVHHYHWFASSAIPSSYQLSSAPNAQPHTYTVPCMNSRYGELIMEENEEEKSWRDVKARKARPWVARPSVRPSVRSECVLFKRPTMRHRDRSPW
uniref:Putative secreted protein n=1 Tax=Anopheles darlingi TaxID=43151 RepID=A0A2M4D2U7_ANODA